MQFWVVAVCLLNVYRAWPFSSATDDGDFNQFVPEKYRKRIIKDNSKELTKCTYSFALIFGRGPGVKLSGECYKACEKDKDCSLDSCFKVSIFYNENNDAGKKIDALTVDKVPDDASEEQFKAAYDKYIAEVQKIITENTFEVGACLSRTEQNALVSNEKSPHAYQVERMEGGFTDWCFGNKDGAVCEWGTTIGKKSSSGICVAGNCYATCNTSSDCGIDYCFDVIKDDYPMKKSICAMAHWILRTRTALDYSNYDFYETT